MLLSSVFRLKDIPYLGHVITQEGRKPYPRKVQGIIDIGRPTTTTEARLLIGMVHYYRDTTALRNNFPGFACWGDLILSQFKNQFFPCLVKPGQKY